MFIRDGADYAIEGQHQPKNPQELGGGLEELAGTGRFALDMAAIHSNRLLQTSPDVTFALWAFPHSGQMPTLRVSILRRPQDSADRRLRPVMDVTKQYNE